jgi:hypothetical protein
MTNESRPLLSAEHRAELLTNRTPVYCHYDGQTNVQPAYIVIDPEAAYPVYADYSGVIGNAVSAYYYHGREHHIYIPATSLGSSIVDFIDAHADEIRAAIADYETDTDRNGNLVGSWNEHAGEILERLERDALDEISTVSVYSLDDLGLDIDADTDAEALTAEIWDWVSTDYECAPDFDRDELLEYIEERVAEAQEDDE